MKKPLILVVDDDEMVRDLVILSLSRANFDFIESYDGESTIALLEKYQPDLVIQDLNLPDIDGLDLNRIILAYNPEVPIIAFTGYNLTLGADYRGFVGFVLKPIVPNNLISVVDQFISWDKKLDSKKG